MKLSPISFLKIFAPFTSAFISIPLFDLNKPLLILLPEYFQNSNQLVFKPTTGGEKSSGIDSFLNMKILINGYILITSYNIY